MLELLSDILVLPLGQVGDDDTGVKATRVGFHPQLLNRLFFEVQETYISILMVEKLFIISVFKKIYHFFDKNGGNCAQPEFQLLEQCP